MAIGWRERPLSGKRAVESEGLQVGREQTSSGFSKHLRQFATNKLKPCLRGPANEPNAMVSNYLK
jgi:hypothetical protein